MERETVLRGVARVGGKVLVEDVDGGGVARGCAGRHVEGRLALAVDQVVRVIHPAILGGGTGSATVRLYRELMIKTT